MDQKRESTLAESVAARLREMITAERWPVGSRIPTEPELCESFGVGRSTLREAVRSLTALGMLEPLTARGTFVRSVTPTTGILVGALSHYASADLVGLRRAIDVEAAQSAAASRTEADLRRMESELEREVDRLRTGVETVLPGSHCSRFHQLIARASGNRLLLDLDASLSAAFAANGLDRQLEEALDAATRIDEHDRIFTAIRAQDVGAVAHHMAMHTDAALRSLRHEPIVTDLTALVRRAQEESRARGIA